jgi:hypothetical protein
MSQPEDELDEYVEDSPEPVRGSQRLLIIILSVGCLALAVSNVVLAIRVTQLRRTVVAERPAVAPAGDRAADAVTPPAERNRAAVPSTSSGERPAVAPAPPAERLAEKAPAERRAAAPAPAAKRPTAVERPADSSAPAASIASSAPTASEPPPPAPKSAPVAAPAPPRLDLPPRSQPQARVAAVARTADRPAAVASSPERSTAAWMIQEYGRPDAESRARAVAEFYGAQSADGAYWRRVLAEINATRR